jgi:glycosyltransferase involved in cell wall biosynthesis
MKILHVYPHSLEKGTKVLNQSVLGLLKGLSQIGLQISVMSTYPLSVNGELITIEGVKVIGALKKRHINPFYISDFWIDEIKKNIGRPDLVHFHFVYDPFQTAFAKKLKKLNWKYITTPRGSLTRLAQKRKRYKKSIANLLFYNNFIKNAETVHALTISEKEQIKETFNCNDCFILQNGVPDSLINKSIELKPLELNELIIEDNELVLGFVGRIDIYHKGIDILLKALSIVNQKLENKIKLFIVGPFATDADKNILKRAIKDLSLSKSVYYYGPKYDDEKLQYFLSCDIFVHTSRFEGMPMAVLEAMALGKPALVTPGTNISKLVKMAGGWETSLKPSSIANSLIKIYQERNNISSRGFTAQNYINKNLTWNKISLKMMEEYLRIVNGRQYD